MLPTDLKSKGSAARIERAPISILPGALMAACALVVYWGVSLVRTISLPAGLNFYLAQPLLWLSLAVAGFLVWRLALHGRPKARPQLIFTAMLVGAFHIAWWLLAGLAFGFGFSAFAHSLQAVVGNLFYAGSVLLGLELTRAVLVGGLFRRPVLAVLAASLFLTWLRVPPARWALASEPRALGPFLGEMLLPYFAEDLLASALALLGGPLPALIYRGMLQGYQWLFPILPQLPWTVTAFVGTLAPALGLVLLQATRGSTRAAARRDQIGPWPFLGMAAVALLWFNVGLFGVRPTLISGSSMDPALQTGDVAVVREVPPAEVQVGDIVRFRYEGVHVIHRVVEVQHAPEGPVFITQGDANNRLDPPVPAERIEGKVVFVIRKVGWIAIGLRQVVQWDR